MCATCFAWLAHKICKVSLPSNWHHSDPGSIPFSMRSLCDPQVRPEKCVHRRLSSQRPHTERPLWLRRRVVHLESEQRMPTARSPCAPGSARLTDTGHRGGHRYQRQAVTSAVRVRDKQTPRGPHSAGHTSQAAWSSGRTARLSRIPRGLPNAVWTA